MIPSLPDLLAHSLSPQDLADIVRNSLYFDEKWYRRQYPEIEYHTDGNPDPAFHYANYGFKEQRLPSVLFDGNKYSEYHHLSDINPLVHYIAQGCPGDYRDHEVEQQLLVKLADNQSLCPSERALLLENSYKSIMHKYLNLAATPATLSEKFYFLRAYRTALWDQVSSLFDLRSLARTLQLNYGFTKEQAPEPILVLNHAQDLTQEIFDSLPDVFYFMCNSLSGTTINVANKRAVSLQDIVVLLNKIEKQCTSHLAERLCAQHSAPFGICVFAPSKSAQSSLEFNVIVANGKVLLVTVNGPERSLNLYDSSFKFLACSLANDNQGARPNFEGLSKPQCFDDMLSKACALGKDVPCLAVRFKLLEDGSYFCQEVRPDLFNGDFILSNDYDLKLGAAFNLD